MRSSEFGTPVNATSVFTHFSKVSSCEVLRYELAEGRPKLLVILGDKTNVPLTHLMRRRLLPRLAETVMIYHYSYLGSRPQGKLGPMHPKRIAAWDDEFARIAKRAVQLA